MVNIKVLEFADKKKFEPWFSSRNISHSFFHKLVKFFVQNICSIIFQDTIERIQEKNVNISKVNRHSQATIHYTLKNIFWEKAFFAEATFLQRQCLFLLYEFLLYFYLFYYSTYLQCLILNKTTKNTMPNLIHHL